MLIKGLWLLIALVFVSASWVRFAPTDVDKWHKAIANPEDKEFSAGLIRVLPNAGDKLQAIQAAALATPRTKQFAGSLSEGMITFVTRSKLWGFPDYATVWINGDDLVIYSRLRFGNGDHGVNGAKVEKWISTLSNP